MKAYLDRVLRILKKRRVEEYLLWSLVLLVVLILTQGVRCTSTVVRTSLLMHSLEQINAPPPRKPEPGPSDKYDIILKKGILGHAAQGGEPGLQVFGILGSTALLGSSPTSVKPYEVGAEVGGGEKLIRIDPDSVVLEKEGQQRTLKVFPEQGGSPPRKEESPGAKDDSKTGDKPNDAGNPGATESPAPQAK